MRLLLCLVLVACTHDVRAIYPAAPEDPTGTLVLKLSEAASGVTVTINGLLVVDDQHTQHVVIERVPVGTVEVMMTANGADKQFRVWVGGDHPTTVPLGAPDQSMSLWKSILGTLITVVAYSLIH